MRRVTLAPLLLMLIGTAWGLSDDGLLSPEAAFMVEARATDTRTIRVRWRVAEGYYLYRQQFGFTTDAPDMVLGEPRIPPGKIKEDPFFGRSETYRGSVTVEIPILAGGIPGRTFTLIARTQGCADLGVCYPPVERRITLSLPATAP